MDRQDFYDRLDAIRRRYEALVPEARAKQEHYDALRKEMCAMLGEERVATWEEGRSFVGSFGKPDWIGRQRTELRRELWELVRDFAKDMADAMYEGPGAPWEKR